MQDFTPTPMTISTEAFYTGFHPYTLQPISSAHTKEEKLAQRKYFFWYEKEYQPDIVRSLTRMHRRDLLQRLFPHGAPTTSHLKPHSSHPQNSHFQKNRRNIRKK